MAHWAMAFASVGETYVVRREDMLVFKLAAPTSSKGKKKTPLESVPQQTAEPIVFPPDERVRFVEEELTEGDTLWTEMGGPVGPLLHRCIAKGITVYRVPVIDIPGVESEEEQDEDEDETKDFQSVRDQQRRDRAVAVAELSLSDPGKFYLMRPADADIASISVMTRNFDNWQRRIRIKAQQQLLQINRDLALYPEETPGTLARLGGHFMRALARLRRRFGGEELLKETVDVERQMLNYIENSLKGLDLYREVFEPIEGCGVVTAARIIDVVGDIRRFPRHAGFKRYTGWYPNGPEGQIIRRKRGEVLRYSTKLKQAAQLYGMQVAQYKRGEVELYQTTKEQELTRVGSKLHADLRARRKVINKFLDRIFREWWRFEVTAGTMTTLHTPVEEIPAGVAQMLSFWYPDLGNQMRAQAA